MGGTPLIAEIRARSWSMAAKEWTAVASLSLFNGIGTAAGIRGL
jgi:hypothetical protein